MPFSAVRFNGYQYFILLSSLPKAFHHLRKRVAVFHEPSPSYLTVDGHKYLFFFSSSSFHVHIIVHTHCLLLPSFCFSPAVPSPLSSFPRNLLSLFDISAPLWSSALTLPWCLCSLICSFRHLIKRVVVWLFLHLASRLPLSILPVSLCSFIHRSYMSSKLYHSDFFTCDVNTVLMYVPWGWFLFIFSILCMLYQFFFFNGNVTMKINNALNQCTLYGLC